VAQSPGSQKLAGIGGGAASGNLPEDALHRGPRPRYGPDGAACRVSSYRRGSACTSRVVAARSLSMWATVDMSNVVS
jgi:hypothetical protein